jgi:hypothetical protein
MNCTAHASISSSPLGTAPISVLSELDGSVPIDEAAYVFSSLIVRLVVAPHVWQV